MKIPPNIEKIRIHRFRSISDQDVKLSNLTILSGKNNSGKSNVLKALNIFFNPAEYSHIRDYNQAYTQSAGGKREVVITIFFKGLGDGALKNDFSITRRFNEAGFDGTEYNSTNKEIQGHIDNNNGNITREFTRFLHKLVYYYIPAVRDKSYVKKLFLEFENLLNDERGEEFRSNMGSLSNILREKSRKISSSFERFISLPTSAELSTSTSDILKEMKVMVETGIKVQKKSSKGRTDAVLVDLFSSGDGILMSYIPHFLYHITSKRKNKIFIWGFEEPENSLEYPKIQKLADMFLNEFSNKAQILITTHSPAFIDLREEERVTFYRVYIEPDDPMQITHIRTVNDMVDQLSFWQTTGKQISLLTEELGLINMAGKIGELASDYMQELAEENRAQKEYIENLKSELTGLKPNKIFICEDSKSISIWRKILEDNGLANVKVFSSEGCTNQKVEYAYQHFCSEDSSYKPMIFRQIDRDGLTEEQTKEVGREINKKFERPFQSRYKAEFLPVNEIENFILLLDRGRFEPIILANNDKLGDAFDQTISSKLRELGRKYGIERFNDDSPTRKLMRESMRVDKIKFINGKEVIKSHNVNNPTKTISVERFLLGLNAESYPIELKNYIDLIKEFFGAEETGILVTVNSKNGSIRE